MSETNSANTSEPIPGQWISADAEATKPLDLIDHELFERVGVGGMGEVYRCGDDALQRDLAIKVLKPELRGDPIAEERFLREARLTGSLQHPGIVPIHRLGRLADGRPCYTMKLIRGRTFADLLCDESDGPEHLPHLLGVIEKVCQAVAFAHSKGVIHRDLKPSNIMVGEFGEVQVMDWGLAKELPRIEPAVMSEEASREFETVARAEEEEGLSRAGAALGTPAYMPPEQAAGDWDIVDERADVFALGAILCELLTGQPPYYGANREVLLRRARRGDLAEALEHLEQCEADEALRTLCRECLALDCAQRLRDAGVVARLIADYKAEVQERLRRAELERVAAETRAKEEQARAALEAERVREAQARVRAERGAKRRMLAVSLALGMILCLGGGGGWWIARERTARAEETVARLEADARANEARNHYLRGEMLNSKGQLNEAIAEYRKGIELQPDNLQYVANLADVFYGADRWDEAITAYENLIRLKPDLALTHRYLGDALANKGLMDRAILAYREAIRLDPHYAEVHKSLGDAHHNNGQQDEAIACYKQALALDPKHASAHNYLGDALSDKGQLEEAIASYRMAIRLKPSEAIYHRDLGNALRKKGQPDAAIACYRQAVALDPKYASAHNDMGDVLFDKGQSDEAIACYRIAVQCKPREALSYCVLGNALLKKGPLDEAMASYKQALALDPNYASAHNGIGCVLADKGQLDEASTSFRHAIRLNPKDAVLHANLGLMHRKKGKLDEAMACYHEAIRLKPDYADAHSGVGRIHLQQGRYASARNSFQRAVELFPTDNPSRQAYIHLLQGFDRFPGLEKKLPTILSGQELPANTDEAIVLTTMCRFQQRGCAASRLFAHVFAAEPKLAADLNTWHRYNAACNAALAAAGQGQDAGLLPDKVAAMFRRWALGWLCDDLSAYIKLAERNSPTAKRTIQERLAHWQHDGDLASVREPKELDRLPDNERTAWQALWRDVDELMNRAAKKVDKSEPRP